MENYSKAQRAIDKASNCSNAKNCNNKASNKATNKADCKADCKTEDCK